MRIGTCPGGQICVARSAARPPSPTCPGSWSAWSERSAGAKQDLPRHRERTGELWYSGRSHCRRQIQTHRVVGGTQPRVRVEYTHDRLERLHPTRAGLEGILQGGDLRAVGDPERLDGAEHVGSRRRHGTRHARHVPVEQILRISLRPQPGADLLTREPARRETLPQLGNQVGTGLQEGLRLLRRRTRASAPGRRRRPGAKRSGHDK